MRGISAFDPSPAPLDEVSTRAVNKIYRDPRNGNVIFNLSRMKLSADLGKSARNYFDGHDKITTDIASADLTKGLHMYVAAALKSSRMHTVADAFDGEINKSKAGYFAMGIAMGSLTAEIMSTISAKTKEYAALIATMGAEDIESVLPGFADAAPETRKIAEANFMALANDLSTRMINVEVEQKNANKKLLEETRAREEGDAANAAANAANAAAFATNAADIKLLRDQVDASAKREVEKEEVRRRKSIEREQAARRKSAEMRRRLDMMQEEIVATSASKSNLAAEVEAWAKQRAADEERAAEERRAFEAKLQAEHKAFLQQQAAEAAKREEVHTALEQRMAAALAAEREQREATQAAEVAQREADVARLEAELREAQTQLLALGVAHQQLRDVLAAVEGCAFANLEYIRTEVTRDMDSIRSDFLATFDAADMENAAKREELKAAMEAEVAKAVALSRGKIESEVEMLEKSITALNGALRDEVTAREKADSMLEEAQGKASGALDTEIEQRKAQSEALKKKAAESRSVAEEAAAKIRNLAHRKGELNNILNTLTTDVANTQAALAAEAALRRAKDRNQKATDDMASMEIERAAEESTTAEESTASIEPTTAIDPDADTDYESNGGGDAPSLARDDEDFWHMI